MEDVKCNICGNEKNELILTVPDCVEAASKFQLVRCRKCDLTFVSPRPQNIDWRKYYPDDTYHAYGSDGMRGTIGKGREKIKKYLMEWIGGYREKGNQIKGVGMINCFISKIMENRLIGVVPSKYCGRLLDVGCGSGELLRWYQNHGWETMGIEPSKKGARNARSKGLQIIESTIEESSLPENYFDAIIMVQVLEHLKDPKASLSKLHRALRPAGLLMAGVPNFLCIDRYMLGSAWLPLETPRHLYYFTPKSLRYLFKAVGFNNLQIRRKTKYGVGLSQIKEACRGKSILNCGGKIAYIFTSPFIKLLTPKHYSSSFVSIFAIKGES